MENPPGRPSCSPSPRDAAGRSGQLRGASHGFCLAAFTAHGGRQHTRWGTQRPPNCPSRWHSVPPPRGTTLYPPVRPSTGTPFPSCGFPRCLPTARGTTKAKFRHRIHRHRHPQQPPPRRSDGRHPDLPGRLREQSQSQWPRRSQHPPAHPGRPRAWSNACPRWTGAAWSRGRAG